MKQPAQGCHWFGGGRVGSLIAAIISDKNPIYVDKVRPDFRQILEIHKLFQIDNPSSSNLGDYRGQHLDLAERQIATECGRTNVTIDESESPLAWLARRRGRNSRALIGAHQFLAGERLRADFTRAHMMPRTTSNWASPISSGRRAAGGERAAGFTETMMAARQCVRQALDAAGPEFGGLLI
jgi:hypothetical protein